MQAALLLVAFSILIGAGVLITEFVHKMETVSQSCLRPSTNVEEADLCTKTGKAS